MPFWGKQLFWPQKPRGAGLVGCARPLATDSPFQIDYIPLAEQDPCQLETGETSSKVLNSRWFFFDDGTRGASE